MDQPPLEKKSVRYKEYIVRGYPSAWKLDDLTEYFGNKSENVHKTFRMKYKGKDSDSVKVVWKSDTEMPPTMIPLFEGTSIENNDDPVMRIEEMEKRPATCYACNKTGHIARHCNDNDEENDRDGHFHARQESTWRRSAPDEAPASDNDDDNDSDVSDETPVAEMRREIDELKKSNEELKSQLGTLKKGIEDMGNKFLEKLQNIEKEIREERSEKEQIKKALSEAMDTDTRGIQIDHCNNENNYKIDNAFSQICEGGKK